MTTPRQIVRWRVAALKTRSNIRRDIGTEADHRRLAKSLRKRQRTPLLILADGTVVDGHRRLAAALLDGIEELDCIVIDETVSPEEFKEIQWVSAVHREDISAYDKAAAVREFKAANPTMTNKALAEELLDIDPAMVTRLLSLFDCPPEVQDAAKARRIGVTDWYAIYKSSDPLAALAKKLSGASRDELEDDNREEKNGQHQEEQTGGQKPTRPGRITVPLATKTATGTVTLSGRGIDLTVAEALLKEALNAVKAAKEKKYTADKAQAVWRANAKAAALEQPASGQEEAA